MIVFFFSNNATAPSINNINIKVFLSYPDAAFLYPKNNIFSYQILVIKMEVAKFILKYKKNLLVWRHLHISLIVILLILTKFANTTQDKNISLCSSPAFSWQLRGQQLQVRPPHLSVHQHQLYFVSTKLQTIPTKIWDVMKTSCR